MQYIRECNNIKAVVLDRVQFVDFMAVKHEIEIVQIKHVARNNVREKLFQGRSATSYFQNRKRRRIGKVLELITIKFPIPEKQIPIGAESRAVAQRCRTVVRLAPRNNRAPHLTA